MMLSREKPLPDIIKEDLLVLFVGFNPGITSAKLRHHYAHRSNRFWRFLYESGLTPFKFNAEDDIKLLELGFGSTNIVDRPSKSASDIKKQELKEGSENLYKLIAKIKPRIVCYVGIGVYKAYASSILNVSIGKVKVCTGLQSESIIEGVKDFVCTNPSGLNTIPYEEQLNCFKALKELIEKEALNTNKA